MKLLSKKLLFPHQPGRAPICGFITYISATEPALLRRYGWEVGDDIHDDFVDSVSLDNGQNWSEPQVSLRSTKVDGGYTIYVENAAIFLPQRNLLLIFTDQKFEPSLDHAHSEHSGKVHITAREPFSDKPAEIVVSDYGLPQGVYVSFCHPLHDSRGRVLVPVQWQRVDTDGTMQAAGYAARPDLPDVMMDVWDVGILIGEFDADGKLSWRLGSPVPCAFEKSSRGMCEGTVAELPSGRLAMVLRGSNAGRPDQPGYKWLSFSEDGGENWSEAEPLPCDDGSLIQSSATGSLLLRSTRSVKLYWIGNLCLKGERVDNNWPRTTLVIAEVQEEPFALKRSTITVIGEQAPHEDEFVQMSNFKAYQDRESGNVMIYLTRYGERGSENLKWMEADHYEYRVEID